MKTCDLAIVGAGPAGLAAAREAVDLGLSVTLIDDNDQPGGQYFRQLPVPFARRGRGLFDKEQERAQRLFRVLDDPRVSYLPCGVVWDAPEADVLGFAAGAESGRIRAGGIVIAAGAHDRPLPFPGWTLPGVVTAGGIQNLLKGQGIVPGGRIVVAGNGPLPLVVAASLRLAGAEVAALVEAAPANRRLWPHLGRLLCAPAILGLAAKYRVSLAVAGIPVIYVRAVVEAHGETSLRAVSIAPIDREGRVDRARVEALEVGTLAIGYGLVPSTELTRLLGCVHDYDQLRGSWLPRRSETLETSVLGVYAVGDGAAIGGAEIALLEGRLAAQAAALRMGGKLDAAARRRRRILAARLARLNRFRDALTEVFAPPCHFLELLTPETLVCRCEEVTLGELRGNGIGTAASMPRLKAATRVGMGRCQGRNCLGTLAALVAAREGWDAGAPAWPRTRPPARPIPLASLLHEEIPPPDLPEDPHLPRRSQAGPATS